MISVSFELKEEDVRAFDLHHYKQSLRAKGARATSWLGVSATLFAAAAMTFLEAPDWRFFSYVILAVAILVTTLYPKYYEAGLILWAERALRHTPSKGQVGAQTVTFTEPGIISGDAKFFWAEVTSVSLTSEYLFILLVWPTGLVLPRRDVAGETIEAIAEFAEGKIRATEAKASGAGSPK